MVDMAAFAEPGFDPKAWVNAACRGEDSERELSDLEMKLQLASEEIAATLEEQSTGAVLRIPRALRDISRIHDDAVSVRSTASAMLLKLNQAMTLSADSVAALVRLDLVKQRMEAAHKTLKDAAGLAELCASVETVFASGDLDQAAETLAKMRRCLVVVGEVPEFASVKRELEALENRLDGMVQTRLSDALLQRKVEAVQAFRTILITIGRYNSLEQHYTKIRMKPLRKIWEEYDSAKPLSESLTSGAGGIAPSFPEWLPRFYDQILMSLEQELNWCVICFPEDYKLLLSKLLVETMTSIHGSFVARIEAEITAGQALTKLPLNVILPLHNVTAAFGKNVARLLTTIEVQDVAHVIIAIYASYESYKQRYGELERAHLAANLNSLDLRGAVQRAVGSRGVELSETVQRMEASVPEVITFLESAIERCFNFTGGSEFEPLLRAMDDTMIQYTSTLHEVLKSLRPVCGVTHVFETNLTRKESLDSMSSKKAAVSDAIPEEEEFAIIQGALQLLTVAESLNSRLAVFEASLRSTLSSRLKHQLPGGTSTSLDIASLRLSEAPDKARRLASLVEQAADHRFHALTHASTKVSTFIEAANELVYEVLVSKVRVRLADVAHMPVWSAGEETTFSLPTFSAYPSPYVTSVGEYLLTLPQQLEPLTPGTATEQPEETEEGQYLATEWMFKVADGATTLYIDQIRGIQILSERGAQQLAADIEYLCNVLLALSMNVPSALQTFQQCVAASREKLTELAKTRSSTELDAPTVLLVCKMRHILVE